MGVWDHFAVHLGIFYLLWNIPPTLMELAAYYVRGGLVEMETPKGQCMWVREMAAFTDFWIYFKRYCDRPDSEAARAYYSYLDWSAALYDKNVYEFRRRLAKVRKEYGWYRPYVYGPFIFNWKEAHNKQWLRGDDAACMKMPMWGAGGEERARAEFAQAKDNCYDKFWHYQKRTHRQVRREQEEKRLQRESAADAQE